MRDLNNRIPNGKELVGWKNVKIKENNEKLITLRNIHRKIQVQPQYFLKGVPNSINDCVCREGVAENLVLVAESLPNNIAILVLDTWRPLAVQQYFFDAQKKKISSKNPTLSDFELSVETQKYVSLPSSDKDCPSPHYTGGSIDLTLIDLDQNRLDMGVSFDHFGIESKTDFFEHKKFDFKDTFSTIQKNRRLLYNSMINHGFTNYHEEWWHYDFGNQFWGYTLNKNAIYCGIKF